MDKDRNPEIRQAKENINVPYWKIAERLGVSENTLLRWMRQELSAAKKETILSEIEKMEDEK